MNPITAALIAARIDDAGSTASPSTNIELLGADSDTSILLAGEDDDRYTSTARSIASYAFAIGVDDIAARRESSVWFSAPADPDCSAATRADILESEIEVTSDGR